VVPLAPRFTLHERRLTQYRASVLANAGRGKENTQIELIEFALHGDFADRIGQLIRQQHHPGQGGVWVVIAFPFLFGSLLIRISPAQYLLLNELA